MIELLAPAGSSEALAAAIYSGANAVYLGGKAFGARQYAPNFSDEELAEAVRLAHLHFVRVYVTVNTLVDDSEIPELIDYLKLLYTIGVDAIIVQDLGVVAVARQVVPDLPLHASTQMTIYNSAGVNLLDSLGFKRIVLARELALAAIKTICASTKLEIEVFIHGALCVCYSGQCLMSSLIGGRSGNRGRCAQPCRLPYKLVNQRDEILLASSEAGEFLLSPRDLNTLEIVPDLIKAGVHSFKIEGRMKRAEYVAVVTDAYKRAVEVCKNNPDNYEVVEQDYKNLAQIFNRDFTTAYLLNKQGKNMMSDRRPNNRGVYIGRVVKSTGQRVIIRLEESLSVGDGLEFWVKVGGRIGVTVSNLSVNGQEVKMAESGTDVEIPVPAGIKNNDRVFKTFDAELMTKAQGFFQDDTKKKIPLDFVVKIKSGETMKVIACDDSGNNAEVYSEFICEPAKKRPMTEELLISQLDRLGNTVFKLQSVCCHIDGEVMVPISEINDVRRKVVAKIEEMRLSRFKRAPLPEESVSLKNGRPKKSVPTKLELAVTVDSLEKLQAAAKAGADWILFGGENYNGHVINNAEYREAVLLAQNYGRKIILATPRIVHEHELKRISDQILELISLNPDAIAVSNLGTLQIVKKYNVPIHGDYPLNAYNSSAIDLYRRLGVASITLSPELNFAQLETINKNTIPVECIVHGRLPLMISEYCLLGSYLGNLHSGNCTGPCKQGQYFLRDRKDEVFPIVTDQFCRMHVLNAKELTMLPHIYKFKTMGIQRIRIEGKYMSPAEVGRVTGNYHDIIAGNQQYSDAELVQMEPKDFTRGHYFRGVL